MVEIEVWDWDACTADDRIGSVRISLGALMNRVPVSLNPVSNGQIVIKSADFITAPVAPVKPLALSSPPEIAQPGDTMVNHRISLDLALSYLMYCAKNSRHRTAKRTERNNAKFGLARVCVTRTEFGSLHMNGACPRSNPPSSSAPSAPPSPNPSPWAPTSLPP